ncbi:MAG: hypothetical protein CMO80_22230 [Verrucomicrobiales bacterium]|nr:hypothetical protein [Verrucomicrobiales bacterium]|tara:strand:+ start:39066 stop:39443 length:378 start_codon:yes stop_codon:yes gene_type:complete
MSSDAFYNELLPEINATIDEFGTSFVVKTPGSYNEDMSVSPDTERTVQGVVADQNFQFPLGSIGSSGSQGQNASWSNRKQVLLKAEADIKESEHLVFEGNAYPLNKAQTIKPANVVLLYIVDVTR